MQLILINAHAAMDTGQMLQNAAVSGNPNLALANCSVFCRLARVRYCVVFKNFWELFGGEIMLKTHL